MPQLLALTGLIFAGGFFVDKTGEAVNDASSGLVKIAIVGGVGFVALKKLKVI
jgi:hypothetical protein